MGFCLFNNVAVAAARVLDAHGAERVMIVDWDVHHGNGTNDIFHDSSEVLFVSLHESPLYLGHRSGERHALARARVTRAVPGGSGDELWCSWWSTWRRRSAASRRACSSPPGSTPTVSTWISSATCRVTDAGFAAMAASLRRLSDELQAPLGLVLEGGYDPRASATVLEVVGAETTAPAPELPVHPYALRLHRASSAGGRRYLGLPRPDQVHVGARRLALEGGRPPGERPPARGSGPRRPPRSRRGRSRRSAGRRRGCRPP